MNGWLHRATALSKVLFAVSLCAYAFVCPDPELLTQNEGISGPEKKKKNKRRAE